MASPRELVAADDARKARKAAMDKAQRTMANDNDIAGDEPDGWIIVDGQPMAYWWGNRDEQHMPVRGEDREAASGDVRAASEEVSRLPGGSQARLMAG